MTMPNFLIVGANKAGTTSLYHYLNQHPQIFMSPIKEPMFFSLEGQARAIKDEADRRNLREAVQDLEDYRALFQEVSNEKAIGEASTSYLHCSWTAANIKRHVPEMKIIIVLRNPVERAYSNYLMYLQWGLETLSFSQAVAEEENRIRNNYSMGWHYVKLGFYHDLVKVYFDLFDKKQIKIYLYEDLQNNPVSLLQDLFRFLGVDETFAPNMSVKHNQSTSTNKAKFPLTLEMQKQLLEVYREDVEKLQNLIQKDLSGWLKFNPTINPNQQSKDLEIANLKQLITSKDVHIKSLEQKLSAIEATKAWRLAQKWYAFKYSVKHLISTLPVNQVGKKK